MRVTETTQKQLARPDRGRQLQVLTALFFERLFAHELLALEEMAREKLLVALGALAGGSAMVSYVLMLKYLWLPDDSGAWLDATTLTALLMCAMALVSALVWESLFIDRVDVSNLAALPVRARTVVAAKLAGLVAFAAACAAAMALPSAGVFVFFLARFHGPELEWGARFAVAHTVALTAAGVAVFLTCATLQGTLALLLGTARFRRVSLLVRTALVVAAVVLISQVGSLRSAVQEVGGGGPAGLVAYPPVWFVGLAETIMKDRSPALARAANLGLGSLAVLGAVAPLLVLAGVRRVAELGDPHVRRPSSPPRLRRLWSQLSRLAAGPGRERALLDFCGACLWRSGRHRLLLASLAAAGTGLLLPWVVNAALAPARGRLDGASLALPHVLSFLLLVGVRWGATQPTTPEAAWVFRTVPLGDRAAVLDALRKAAFLDVLLPLHLVLWGVLALLAGPGEALLHCAFSLSAAAVLAEVMLSRSQRVPFASPGAAGESNLKATWAVYLLGLSLWSSTLAELEAHFLWSWQFWLAWGALVVAARWGVAMVRRSTLEAGVLPGLDDLPEPAFVALDLDG
ncbi:MAG: hypothetical protein AB2L07_06470 [Thermoanaerobaculaceae bacterium]